MSYEGDQAREFRWKKAGHVRLHMRITKDADDMLTLLCIRYRLDRRQVIERLLRGELIAADVMAAKLGLCPAERLQPAEVA